MPNGVVQPIVAGTVRNSRSGAPWVSFGGPYWYRLMDTTEARCVINDDGDPIGVADRGPLVLGTTESGLPQAVVVNTGWNLEMEIIW